MILISGSEDTGYEATIKIGSNDPAVEIVVECGDEIQDDSDNDFSLKIGKKSFPLEIEKGVLRIQPATIKLASGIHPFTVSMNKEIIMSGYLEWTGDDN